jgi:hypothetical protein
MTTNVVSLPSNTERVSQALSDFPVRAAAAQMLLDVKDFAVISTRSERLTNTQMYVAQAILGATILETACQTLGVSAHTMLTSIMNLPTFSEVLGEVLRKVTAETLAA